MDIEVKTALKCFEYVHPPKGQWTGLSVFVRWPMTRGILSSLISEVQTIVRSVNEFKLLWRNLQWVCCGEQTNCLIWRYYIVRISLWCASISLIVTYDTRSMTSTKRFIYTVIYMIIQLNTSCHGSPSMNQLLGNLFSALTKRHSSTRPTLKSQQCGVVCSCIWRLFEMTQRRTKSEKQTVHQLP